MANKIFHANTDYKLVDKTSNLVADIGENYLTYWYYKRSPDDPLRKNLKTPFPFDLQNSTASSSAIRGNYEIKVSPDFTDNSQAKFRSHSGIGYPVLSISSPIADASLDSGKTLSEYTINWKYDELPSLYSNPDYTPIFARGNGRCNLPNRYSTSDSYHHFLARSSSSEDFSNSYWLIDMENSQIYSRIQNFKYDEGPSYSIGDRKQLIIDMCGCGGHGGYDSSTGSSAGGGGGAFVSALLSFSSLTSAVQSNCAKFLIAVVNNVDSQPDSLTFNGTTITLPTNLSQGTHLLTSAAADSATFKAIISVGGGNGATGGKILINTKISQPYGTNNIALIFGRHGASGGTKAAPSRRATVTYNLVNPTGRLWWLQNDIISVDVNLDRANINDDNFYSSETNDSYAHGGAGCRPKFLGEDCLAGTSTQKAGWGAGGAGVSTSYSNPGAGFAVIYW